MRLCYVDEAGDTGAILSPTYPIQPVLVICGIVIEHHRLHDFTHEFIALKKRYFPNLLPPGRTHLAWILRELKGSEIRKSICSTDRNERRQAIGLLDRVVDLLQRCAAKIFGRVWIKQIGSPINGNAIYTSSTQGDLRSLATSAHRNWRFRIHHCGLKKSYTEYFCRPFYFHSEIQAKPR